MSVKLDRNNTNFASQIHAYLKDLDFATEEQRKYSFLKYYQNLVREFINNVDIDARGLLIYKTMGLGKSIELVALALDQMDRGREVIVLLTKSLQENLRGNIRKYIRMRTAVDPTYRLGLLPEADLERYIDTKFNFVSMNASNMIRQMVRAAEGDVGREFSAMDKRLEYIVSAGTLDGKLVLVDEAQNLFRAITNGSKNAKEFYDMVIASRDCRIVFFSGTPISSHPFELIPCFNMLGSRRPGFLLFPESYTDFYKYFVDRERRQIANRGKFQNRITGLVSYVTHTSKIAKSADGKGVEFPEELPTIVERLPMDPEQYVIYQLARDKEAEESKYGRHGETAPKPMAKPKKEFASSYKQKSRQLSNYCPPAGFRDQKFSKIDVSKIPADRVDSPKLRQIYKNIVMHRGRIGFVYSQFVGAGGLGILRRYLDLRSWSIHPLQRHMTTIPEEEHEEPLDDPIAGPETHPDQPIVLPNDDPEHINTTPVDESTVSVEGAGGVARRNLVKENAAILDACAAHGGSDEPYRGVYAVISGSVDTSLRQQIQDVYNSDDNRYGGVIDLLLISSTGAEGLDLKNVGHEHIMEPYWNYARIGQIKARGVRNDSHRALPPDQRVVQPYVYICVKPEEMKTSAVMIRQGIREDPTTTDEDLWNEAIANQELVQSYLQALQESSIECQLNEPTAYKCRVCNPTNTKLFYDDIDLDMKTEDKCTNIETRTVQAREIVVNGARYYYSEDAVTVYGYRVYEYDPMIKGMREMPQDIPLYLEIVEAIEHQKK